MSQEACPKLLAATRRLAGWQLFRVGVFRVGAYAAQERRARLRYYNAAYLCQKLALRVHHREVLAKRRQSKIKEDPLTLAKLTRPFKPQLWRRAKVSSDATEVVRVCWGGTYRNVADAWTNILLPMSGCGALSHHLDEMSGPESKESHLSDFCNPAVSLTGGKRKNRLASDNI